MNKVEALKEKQKLMNLKMSAQIAEAEKLAKEREQLERQRFEKKMLKRVEKAAKRTRLTELDLQQSEIEAAFNQLIKDKKAEADRPKVEEPGPQHIPVNQGYGGFNSLNS